MELPTLAASEPVVPPTADNCRGALDAVTAVVAAMRKHPEDAAAAERGCFSLDGITADRLGQQAAVEACAPAAIVAAMLAHPCVAGVAYWGCRALNSITTDHVAGQLAAVSAGAPRVIVAAMHTHMHIADIALWCSRALGRIASSFRSGQEEVTKAGALVAIVAAVRTHVGVADVAGWGCTSIDCIVADHAEGQQAAVDAGAPAAIVAAMSTHPCISQQGCRALASLVAFFPAGQQAALAAEAPDAFVAVMVRANAAVTADRAALCQWGCLALCRIAQFITADADNLLGPTDVRWVGRFTDAVRSRLPAASFFCPAKDSSSTRDGDACGVVLYVTVGCDADEQLARDCARICGLHSLPSYVRITSAPDIIAATGISDSQCIEVQADATGQSAIDCVINEARRILPYVTIETWNSPVLEELAEGAADDGAPRVGLALPSRLRSSPSTRIVVPFSRGIVAHATLSYLLSRLRAPQLDVSVWCAVETKLGLPRLSDIVHVVSPDVPPLPTRGILTGDTLQVCLERVPRRDPIVGGPAVAGRHVVECTAGAWIGRGPAAYLLTTAHMVSKNSTRARTRHESTDAASEFLPFVGSVDPSFIGADTRCFVMKPSITWGAQFAVADIALFKAPHKYSAGAACVRGVDFMDSNGVVLPPIAEVETVSCSLPQGDGYFLISGTARRLEGNAGCLREHVVFLAQHIVGGNIVHDNSGSALLSTRGVHSFVRSRVLAASFPVCRAALLAGDEAVDALLVELARNPTNAYLTFTPASCALAQAASILGVSLRELSYTAPPVVSRTNCTVS